MIATDVSWTETNDRCWGSGDFFFTVEKLVWLYNFVLVESKGRFFFVSEAGFCSSGGR